MLKNGLSRAGPETQHSGKRKTMRLQHAACAVLFFVNLTRAWAVLEARKHIQGAPTPSKDAVSSILEKKDTCLNPAGFTRATSTKQLVIVKQEELQRCKEDLTASTNVLCVADKGPHLDYLDTDLDVSKYMVWECKGVTLEQHL